MNAFLIGPEYDPDDDDYEDDDYDDDYEPSDPDSVGTYINEVES